MAILALSAQGELPYRTFLFANVGEDSEDPATLTYLRDVAVPYAEAHGIEIHELHRRRRDGTIETLRGRLERPGIRSVDIPARLAGGAPGHRKCTEDFKLAVVRRWCREHGATKESPAEIAIGFSMDEIGRIGRSKNHPIERKVFPLLDLRLGLAACIAVIRRAGLPIPPKSSCYFCPFRNDFAEMRRDRPEVFAQAVEVEHVINRTRARLGRDRLYLARAMVPLEDLPEEQDGFDFGPETCDSGGCMT